MITGIAFAPLLFIAAALIVFVIYMTVYFLVINRKVRSGERKKIHIPSSGSVGFTVLVVGVVICLALCLSKISSLEKEIFNERNNVRSMYASLDEKIISLEEMLKKQNSLFTSEEMSAGEYDKNTHTGDIFVTLTPKTLSNDTQMTLAVGGKEYKGERNGSAFKFTVKFDLLKDRGDYSDFIASVTSGGETKTETLEYMNFLGAEQKFINVIFASCTFPMDFKNGKATLNSEDSPIDIEVVGAGENTFESAKIIIEKNGEKVSEKDITSYFTNQKSDYSISVPLNESFDAKNGDRFIVYVTARDSFGLTHKAKAMYCEMQEGDYSYYIEYDSDTDYELSVD